MSLLTDGFKTLIGFSLNGTVLFEEIEVTPFGYAGGGGIEVSTMRNTRARTKVGKQLLDVTDMALTVAYDPTKEVAIRTMMQSNQQITVTLPTGNTKVFWGFLDEFQPGPHVEGERPTADVVLIASNRNNSGVETLPSHT